MLFLAPRCYMAIIGWVPKLKRTIMRVEISPGTPEALDAAVQRVGSTNVSVCSRVVDWLCDQDDVVQAAVLGLYPSAAEQPDVKRLALQRMLKA